MEELPVLYEGVVAYREYCKDLRSGRGVDFDAALKAASRVTTNALGAIASMRARPQCNANPLQEAVAVIASGEHLSGELASAALLELKILATVLAEESPSSGTPSSKPKLPQDEDDARIVRKLLKKHGPEGKRKGLMESIRKELQKAGEDPQKPGFKSRVTNLRQAFYRAKKL